jgi:hypothetical protein
MVLLHSRDNRQQEFEIEINRAEVVPFDSRKHAALPPGLLFSIGAKFRNISSTQREFLASFMKGKPEGSEEGFISKDKVTPGS